MPSASVDKQGNMAVGYNVGNATQHPASSVPPPSYVLHRRLLEQQNRRPAPVLACGLRVRRQGLEPAG
jgi:hypothetical protein